MDFIVRTIRVISCLLILMGPHGLSGCASGPVASRWSSEVVYELSQPRISIAPRFGSSSLDAALAKRRGQEPADSPRLVAMLHQIVRQRVEEGRLDEAEEILNEIRTIAKHKVDANDAYHLLLERDAALLEIARGAYEKALASLLRCIDIVNLHRWDDDDLLANLHTGIARVRHAMWDFTGAEIALERAYHHAQDARNSSSPRIMAILRARARLYADTARLDEAERDLSRAFEIAVRSKGEASQAVAEIRGALAWVTALRGDFISAKTRYREAVDTLNPITQTPSYARLLIDKAQVHTVLSEFKVAADLQVRALKIASHYYGSEHVNLAAFELPLAQTLVTLGAWEKAAPLCRRNLKTASKRFGKAHIATVSSRNCMAALCAIEGRTDISRKLSRESMDIVLASAGKNAPINVILAALYALYVDPRDLVQVEHFMERAATLANEIFGSEHPATALRWKQLADVRTANGEPEAALALLESASRVAHRRTGNQSVLAADIFLSIAHADLQANRLSDANEALDKAEAIYSQRFGDMHIALASVFDMRAKIRGALGEYRAATMLGERAAAIRNYAKPTTPLCTLDDPFI